MYRGQLGSSHVLGQWGRIGIGWAGFALGGAALGCGGGDGRENDSTAASGVTAAGSAGDSSSGAGTDGDGGSDEGLDSSGGPECTTDEDCPEGERCGEGSQTCLGPSECGVSEDCDPGFTCDEAGTCTIGGDCGGFVFELEAVPPNLLVLLDRSGSMDGEVEGTGQNRWDIAKQALAQLTTAFDSTIRFGLATYSSCQGGGCSGGTIVIPVAPNNAAAINAFLDTTVGQGSDNGMGTTDDGKVQYLCDSGDPETSTGVALHGLVSEATLLDMMRKNAVLLITDGAESSECTSGGTITGPSGAAALLAQTPPVSTYAVGFVGANEQELGQIAVAGGTNVSYFANDPTMLQAALDAIAQEVASCTFTLDEVPEDPSMIYVFFDKNPNGVPVDPTNGWTYDPATNTITFHGQACEAIQNGTVVEVDIVYGCNMPPIG